jgi:anti-sigma factor RsiW
MQKITRFTEEERENLTAYLDGELEEKLAAEIEHKLTRSEVARREVDILSRTWDMLSLLPRTNVAADFSQKTMAIAKQAEGPALLDRSKQWLVHGRRAAFLAAWAAGICVAAAVGFRITNQWVPDESRLLVEELPIIENLDSYREIGDVEFLQQLRRTHVFDQEATHAPAN